MRRRKTGNRGGHVRDVAVPAGDDTGELKVEERPEPGLGGAGLHGLHGSLTVWGLAVDRREGRELRQAGRRGAAQSMATAGVRERDGWCSRAGRAGWRAGGVRLFNFLNSRWARPAARPDARLFGGLLRQLLAWPWPQHEEAETRRRWPPTHREHHTTHSTSFSTSGGGQHPATSCRLRAGGVAADDSQAARLVGGDLMVPTSPTNRVSWAVMVEGGGGCRFWAIPWMVRWPCLFVAGRRMRRGARMWM